MAACNTSIEETNQVEQTGKLKNKKLLVLGALTLLK